MHIHSYQIHNVLNVYRRQLSRGTMQVNGQSASKTPSTADRIEVSIDGQRQSLVDKISAQIVERITQFGPETQFEAALADRITDAAAPPNKGLAVHKGFDNSSAFTYTVIDEYNQKRTNTLAVLPFGLPTGTSENSPDLQEQDKGMIKDTE